MNIIDFFINCYESIKVKIKQSKFTKQQRKILFINKRRFLIITKSRSVSEKTKPSSLFTKEIITNCKN
ncbi:MAG TPA: hypothetical protein DD740_02355 [Chryseobacterium sp.]|nr:hypothetical protein [Chryseobacterium sp.]